MNEKLIGFLDHQFPDPDFFFVEFTGITYPDSRYCIKRRRAHIYCLEYIIDGTGTVNLNDTVFHPKKGDMYYLPAGARHHYFSSPTDPWTKIWINARGRFVDTLFQSYEMDKIYHLENCNLYHLFQDFVSLCENAPSDPYFLQKQCILLYHEILLNMYSHFKTSQLPDTRNVAQKARTYIDRHIYNNITINEIAMHCCLSSSQLTRVFKKEYDQTPYNYIIDCKLDIACRLLSNTTLTVKEIAYRLSFCDEHYFSNLFSGRKGCSPKQFRLNS